MLVREILPEEKDRFNGVVQHPLQSYEWGEFRGSMGLKVVRLGVFDGTTLVGALQFTVHKFPVLGINVGYLPKCPYPTVEILEAISRFGRANKCGFVQLEPNEEAANITDKYKSIKQFPGLVISKKPLFTKYTFYIDLTRSEEELLAQMKEKTRYNVRLALKKGVTVNEETGEEAFEIYLKLLDETAKRDKFFAHNNNYHRQMWKNLAPDGIAHLLIARYENVPLVAWVVFVWKGFLYYTYGTSSSLYRDTMASSLMYFEAMKFGKKMGLQSFDLWGALGPNPDPKDPFYGFHHFKEGFGPRLIEFAGSYDLILNQPFYGLYHKIDDFRWKILNFKRKLPF